MKPYRYITLCESDLLSLELGHQTASGNIFGYYLQDSNKNMNSELSYLILGKM